MKRHLIPALLLLVVGCSKPSDEGYMKRAVEAHKADQFDEALENYQAVVDTYPNSPLVPEALYAVGSIYQTNKRDMTKAIEYYKKVATQFPDHATASSSLFLVGYLYNNELKNVDSARAAYESFIRRYPTSPMISSAKFELENLGKDPAELLNRSMPMSDKPPSKPSGKRAK